MSIHLKNCSYFQELGKLYSLPCDNKVDEFILKEHLISAFLNDSCIIDQNIDLSQLSILEASTIRPLNLKLMMV